MIFEEYLKVSESLGITEFFIKSYQKDGMTGFVIAPLYQDGEAQFYETKKNMLLMVEGDESLL